jgi:hypothetical protein
VGEAHLQKGLGTQSLIWLAQQLRPYGIKPKTMRIAERLGKGYEQEDCMDTFRRYIPKSALEELRAEVAEQTAQPEEAKAAPQDSALTPLCPSDLAQDLDWLELP